jgi:hypothetical protein
MAFMFPSQNFLNRDRFCAASQGADVLDCFPDERGSLGVEGREPSDWPIAARNDKFLASLDFREQLGEMRLRFGDFYDRSQLSLPAGTASERGDTLGSAGRLVGQSHDHVSGSPPGQIKSHEPSATLGPWSGRRKPHE